MPKRLLRYALARLDLLDSEALDLDNLELALGRNAVFEFKDVGIQLPVSLCRINDFFANITNKPPRN